jgi:hypothetical protein
LAIICSILIMPGEALRVVAQGQDAQAAQPAQPDKTLSADELDSLVAPIALYPDPLLSQALVASTYPLEIVQLQQWLEQNKNLKDKALTDAAMKQPWDPSVQAMAALPDLVKQLGGNIQWTTDLGNAFLAQEKDVMDAVQRMRAKAKDKGNLKSTDQQKVETQVIENKQTIVIQPSDPQVIYVPSYNPTVVYGAPAYPYPPVTYPPPGYYAAGAAISFGVGMMVGAAMSGGWGWGCGWGGNNNVYINNNNNFVRNTNVQGGNRVNARGGNSTWQHNPQHRGAAPYSNRATANQYGGTARGDARGNSGLGNNRGNGGVGDRGNNGGLGGNRGNNGGLGDNRGNNGGLGDRGNSGGLGNTDRGGNRASAGTMDRSADRGGAGGGDRVGNRSVPDSSRGGGSGAFGGGSAGSARASSSRGSSSFGGGGGGGRGGGGRGGGGRRR